MTPPPGVVAKAKEHADGWVYEIVGPYVPEVDFVPPEAIKGACRVGPTGELTGEYEPNPNFREPEA